MTISVLKNHPYVFERTRVSYQVTNVGLKSKIDHFTVVTFDSQYIILTHFIIRPNLAWSYSVARNDGGFFFWF